MSEYYRDRDYVTKKEINRFNKNRKLKQEKEHQKSNKKEEKNKDERKYTF